MIELIVGEKGKGKSKTMVAKAVNDSKLTGCNILFIDVNNKYSDELNEYVKLINIQEYNINTKDMFLGFIYGILSQNNSLDKIFIDNILSMISLSIISNGNSILEYVIEELQIISEKYETDFVIGLSMNADSISGKLKDYITISL